MRGRDREGARRRIPDPSRGRAGLDPHPAGWARPAHGGGARRDRCAAHEGRGLMPIRFTLADHVARITIDRPEVMNAIDVASERELERIWLEIEGNREVRVVVLTGAGDRAF